MRGYDLGVTRTLVLWDIDYTLLQVGGMSSEVFAEAFRNATGLAMERLADLPGKTDRAIITETLELHGKAASSDLVDAFADALADGFRAREGMIRASGQLLPGAAEALQALAERRMLSSPSLPETCARSRR
jgi:phosphoglycolate phosphatase-like HAD superfamily hydrolase